jgi:hypothetical protein
LEGDSIADIEIMDQNSTECESFIDDHNLQRKKRECVVSPHTGKGRSSNLILKYGGTFQMKLSLISEFY